MPTPAHLAIDMGAESGRVIVGTLANGRVAIDEAHRFNHLAVDLPTGLHWDTTGILREITAGLAVAARRCAERGLTPTTVGADTWGVDFALLDTSHELLGLPHCYRDPRTAPHYDAALAKLGKPRIYGRTGIQFMPINTLYHLMAAHADTPGLVQQAHRLLFMPDLIHFFLSGKLANERTIASTSQMLDTDGRWATDLLAQLDLPTHMLHAPVEPGTRLGALRPSLAEATGLPSDFVVVLPGSHDTASAVAAVPADPADHNWCYLSSGTWSLLGVERDTPDTSDAALAAGFTNEAGVGGKIRFLKNISGLYIVQEIRRDLARQGNEHDYPTLTRLAEEAAGFETTLDANDPRFATPGDMPAKLRAAAEETGQPAPQTPGELVRCALRSLAKCYADTIDQLRDLGNTIDRIHLVGGGGQNQLLNQLTADATGLPVIVGPTEATAIGNLLTQALGGTADSLKKIREVVRASTELSTVTPAR
ncbi:MAG: rhamnulokinase family protein [Planctomycetota bacterium]